MRFFVDIFIKKSLNAAETCDEATSKTRATTFEFFLLPIFA